MSSWRVAAADLLLGAACAACDRPAVHLCPACADAMRPEPERVGERPRIVAARRYDGVPREVIVAWKERGHHGLLPWLALALAAAVLEVVDDLDATDRIVLVPIPTSRRNRRRRGQDHLDVLARATAGTLTRCGVPARVAPLLRLARQTRDQADLTAAERETNVRGAFRSSGVPPVGQLIVVDDVTTTGSTLHAALQALSASGRVAAGAATVAWRP